MRKFQILVVIGPGTPTALSVIFAHDLSVPREEAEQIASDLRSKISSIMASPSSMYPMTFHRKLDYNADLSTVIVPAAVLRSSIVEVILKEYV